MIKYLILRSILILFVFTLSYHAFADEVEQKTDGSFAGYHAPEPVNSSFMGDDSNSVDNDAFQGQNSYFAGDNSDKEEQGETINSFSGDKTFIGNTYG